MEVTGLRLSRAGQEQVARADAYIAALDVPGAGPHCVFPDMLDRWLGHAMGKVVWMIWTEPAHLARAQASCFTPESAGWKGCTHVCDVF